MRITALTFSTLLLITTFSSAQSKHQYVDLGLSVKWAGNWRIPTKAEIKELIENCTWTWTTRNNINGYLVTGKKPGYTDRSIFIPVTGAYDDGKIFNPTKSGHYWSRNCGTLYPPDAYTLELSVREASVGMESRCQSLAVRPVCK